MHVPLGFKLQPSDNPRGCALISVVMPTYNRADTLARAIDSVLAQTHTDWELVIIDDGSTDDTREVLARYEDPRIRVVLHDRNKGVTAGENTGFDSMRGDWFTMLGSDDEMLPEALETLVATAAETGATAVTCNCLDSQTGEFSGHGWQEDGWRGAGDAAQVSGEHWGLTKTSLLGDTRFDERIPGYEGVLWTKITHRAGRRYYLHKALRVYHTEGDDRLSAHSAKRSLAARLSVDAALAEDSEYLELLRELNPKKSARLRRRGLWARFLLRTRLLERPPLRDLRPRQFYLAVLAAGGVAVMVLAAAARGARRLRPGRTPS
jgi:glycosyltransferase involved in cell wall biosynthesis